MGSQYTQLSVIENFQDRVDFMVTVNLTTEAQPFTFTQHFWDVKDQSDPMNAAYEVAQAFKARNGLVIIEAEGSYCYRRFMTIMDEFEIAQDEVPDPVSNWILKRAFQKAGFKYARDCDETDLRILYAKAGYDGFRP